VKKIPDAAFPISAVAEYRFLDTIPAPNKDLSTIEPLLNVNMSQLYILTPLLRAPCILLVNLLSEEFSDSIMAGFAKAWANIVKREDAQFPNWVGFFPSGSDEISPPVNFFVVLTPDTLSSLDTPSDLGISEVLKAYRFVSHGIEIKFNVPDLVNQATSVMARVPAEATNITPQREHVRGYDEFYIHAGSGIEPNIVSIFPGGATGVPPINQLDSSGTLPSPTVQADNNFRNQSGTFTINVGETFRYESVDGRIYLVNLTTDTRLVVRSWAGTPNSTRMYVREALDVEIPISEVRSDMTKMILPMVQQKDLQAQIVGTSSFLMKDYEGVYLPNQIWKPIFEPQVATSYTKIVFVNDQSELSDLDDPTVGWFDSYDRNFGFAVVNIQGMSQSAAPLVKIIRTDEQVPSAKSLVGAYTTRCSPPCPVALDVTRALTDRLPMGYPADFNSMGKLFGMIRGMLKNMPVALAHAMNISSQIGRIVDDISELDVPSKNPRRVRFSQTY
jgi:hypothetical protein